VRSYDVRHRETLQRRATCLHMTLLAIHILSAAVLIGTGVFFSYAGPRFRGIGGPAVVRGSRSPFQPSPGSSRRRQFSPYRQASYLSWLKKSGIGQTLSSGPDWRSSSLYWDRGPLECTQHAPRASSTGSQRDAGRRGRHEEGACRTAAHGRAVGLRRVRMVFRIGAG